MEAFFEYLNIPKTNRVGNTVFKKMFEDNADLTSTDKKLFTKQIDKITWEYSLKPQNTNIMPYKDEIREYTEIEVILVKLHQEIKTKRIAEVIMRSIPYPILLVISFEDKIQLYTAHQRQNLNDANKITLEELVFIDFFNLKELTKQDKKFLESLDFKALNQKNFYEMYSEIIDKINLYNASKLTDSYINQTTPEEAKAIYEQVNNINTQIERLKNRFKSDTPINERVSLNIEIHNLKEQRQHLLDKIE